MSAPERSTERRSASRRGKPANAAGTPDSSRLRGRSRRGAGTALSVAALPASDGARAGAGSAGASPAPGDAPGANTTGRRRRRRRNGRRGGGHNARRPVRKAQRGRQEASFARDTRGAGDRASSLHGDGGGVAALPAGDGRSAPHPVEVAGLLHELSALLLGTDDVAQALDRLAVFTANAVPGALRCSVALIGEGGPPTFAASDPGAHALDDLQYATGDGPGLEAARTRAVVVVPDLSADGRWPELAERARAEGVQAVASIPLDLRRSAVGAVTLFAERPGIEPEALLTAMAVVGQAELLVGEVHRRAGQCAGSTVDRAAGVIIAQRGCGVREAYDVLRDTSQRLGLPREEVAERLIAAAARNADA
ncbi:GAF and ANTAR domain-containing protein [Couchioplanes azureus]|uniref:GAF and ANTAR domain-containing protein n=1 Tax=Couchioplanes caeruleus TaxID=56438 RepID=UPI0016708067|nr:GAF and ANTAR domain-containing protein [Couchioplanes caeruleus]